MKFADGKYKGELIDDVFAKDALYVKRMGESIFPEDKDEVDYIYNLMTNELVDYLMPWGRYKGESIWDVKKKDFDYFEKWFGPYY